MNLSDIIQQATKRLETLFDLYLIKSTYPAPDLQTALAYSACNGGKRIRPLLVYLSGYALHAAWEELDGAACAIELMHVYSLIHDDLPAMDNADLRRGKPSCHKAYNEATAILAGDALQSLAFEVLAIHPSQLTTEQRLAMVTLLSQASGIKGMAGGQALDLQGTTSLAELTHMYHLKTGALLNASVQLGAVAAHVTDPTIVPALQLFAKNIGLAFQIQDDVLDIEASTQTLGKPQGKDLSNHKITYPTLLGIDESRRQVYALVMEAVDAILFLKEPGRFLIEFATSLLHRKK